MAKSTPPAATDVSIDTLIPDPKNARKRTARNLEMIESSLREVGTGRAISIDEENVIIAGNGTVQAAKNVGLTKVHIVDVDADTLVAVRRKGLTPEQKKRMALQDNRSAELAEWDGDVLKAMRDEGLGLDDLFTKKELDGILDDGQVDQEPVEPLKVERPTEVAWVLCAIPLSEWPKNQPHVEALQGASVFTTMAMRPKGK